MVEGVRHPRRVGPVHVDLLHEGIAEEGFQGAGPRELGDDAGPHALFGRRGEWHGSHKVAFSLNPSRLTLSHFGKPFDEEADAAMRAMIEDQIERESLAMFMSGKIYDDGIIDPRDTRTVLTMALSAVHSGPVQGTDSFGVFRM